MKLKTKISFEERSFIYAFIDWNPCLNVSGDSGLNMVSDLNWEEIMLLCEKVNSLGFRVILGNCDDEFHVTKIHGNLYPNVNSKHKITFDKWKLEYKANLLQSFASEKIDSAYNAILNFAKWYNNNIEKFYYKTPGNEKAKQ